MKTLLSLSLSALAIAAASPAFAQSDDGAQSWTGPYVGGSLGYGWQPNNGKDNNETVVFDTNLDGTYGDTVRTGTGGNAFSPGFCRGRALGSLPSSCAGDQDGKVAWSVHAGYDYQMGNFVVGAVVEGGQSNIKNSVTAFSTTPANYVLTRELAWDGAARLRAGVAFGTGTLIYGTGGVAYGKIKNSFATTNTFNTFTETNRTDKDWGWTAGGGIEQKVSQNFSIGLLYKYTRFNDDGYTVNAGQGTPPSATNPFVNPTTTAGSTNFQRTSDRFDNHSVRATASFRF
ncbi:outer membrane protein [Sphingobium algorifonticola]|uniref:Porin family protein n=1 Tax=Sphingobium algorifonticola TaxID=2008318 RepID=A0A437J7I2_9SPHN|nr:outer membrane beta-barrel protein [Sphingobium algorifonticola]RVT40956.1 porin family protein [Sphingobium algorifonticola]